MQYLSRLRQRYANLSDNEFERFLRLAYSNQVNRIPAVYRQGFQQAANVIKRQQGQSFYASPSLLPAPGLIAPPQPDSVRRFQQQEQQRWAAETERQMQEAQEASIRERFGVFAPIAKPVISTFEFLRPGFSFTTTLGGSAVKTIWDGLKYLLINAASPITTNPEELNKYEQYRQQRSDELVKNIKGHGSAAGMMLSDLGINTYNLITNSPGYHYMLDAEDYLTLGVALQHQPDLFDRIRQGQQNEYFDVIKVNLVKRDGTTEERWVAPFEIDILRNSGGYLAVIEDESTRLENTDRVSILGREFNRHYLSNFIFTAIGDPLNFVGNAGAAAGAKFFKTPLVAATEMAEAFKAAKGLGRVGFVADALNFAFAAGMTAPFHLIGKATGLATRRLPSVAEATKMSGLMNNAVAQAAVRVADNISSTFLPHFYNLETQGMRSSNILKIVRPLFNMSREKAQEFVAQAPQKAQRVLDEWGQEGVDFSDESWEFIQTTLGLNNAVPQGQRKQWLAENGQVQNLIDTTAIWSNPPPVASAVADFAHPLKPAYQAWKAGLHTKNFFEKFAATRNSNLKRTTYPIVRLFNEGLRNMEEVGREVRQTQQAVIETQREVAQSLALAMAGNPAYRETALGKAIEEHENAVAKLESAVGRHTPLYLKKTAELLDAAGISIADEASATRLLDTLRSVLKNDKTILEELDRLSRIRGDEAITEADRFLRERGILTNLPEQSLEIVKMLNSRSYRRFLGNIMRMSDVDSADDAMRTLTRSIVELRRYGFAPEMASGVENIFYAMRNVYDTLTPEQRRPFQESLNKHLAALMTGQAFDPREIKAFYNWMDEAQLPETVKDAAKQALEAAANRSMMERFFAANADNLKRNVRQAVAEIDRVRTRMRQIQKINDNIIRPTVDPCV